MSDTRDFIYTIPSKVLFDDSLTKNDLKIYMIVRSFMDTTGKPTYASNQWIAEKLNIDPRSVRRSISTLVEKFYLTRTGDSKRYLSINYTPMPEEPVSYPEQDNSVPPPRTILSSPPDNSVLQLDQNKLLQKQTTTASAVGCSTNKEQEQQVVVRNYTDLLANKLTSMGIDLHPNRLKKLIAAHGGAYVDEKIEALKAAKDVVDPIRWLMAALKDDYHVPQTKSEPVSAEIIAARHVDMVLGSKAYYEALRALKREGVTNPTDLDYNTLKNMDDLEFKAIENEFNIKLSNKIIELGGHLPDNL